MKPCKHLDYEREYIDCEIRDLKPDYPDVRYWLRLNPPYAAAPTKVQFCKLRGRINSIFDCYQKGPFFCYEPSSEKT